MPALSLLILAAPSLSLLYLLDEVGSPLSTTKVQGHQWFWVYESSDLVFYQLESYLTPRSTRLLGTDNSLILYCSQVIRLLITAADVLHS